MNNYLSGLFYRLNTGKKQMITLTVLMVILVAKRLAAFVIAYVKC